VVVSFLLLLLGRAPLGGPLIPLVGWFVVEYARVVCVFGGSQCDGFWGVFLVSESGYHFGEKLINLGRGHGSVLK
jgi:hypothetical protein